MNGHTLRKFTFARLSTPGSSVSASVTVLIGNVDRTFHLSMFMVNVSAKLLDFTASSAS